MAGVPSGSLEIGRLGRPHGLRGELMITLTSDRRERLAVGSRWWVAGREMTVAAARPHQGRHLVKLSGVDDRDAATALTGERVYAEPLGADAAKDVGVVWVHEVIGSQVIDTAGTPHGTVVSVEANPAHDLLVLESGALVPMVFVVEQQEGRVVIDPPEGLLD